MTTFAKKNILELLNKGAKEWNNWRNSNLKMRLKLHGVSLESLNMYFKADLSKVEFNKSKIINSNFEGANLIDSSFKNCDLTGTSFRKANCESADFTGAILKNCNFHRARLPNANFSKVKLIDSDFTVTNAKGLNLKDAIVENITYPKSGFEFSTLNTSILELSFAANLENIHKQSQPFLLKYVSDVYDYVNRVDEKDEWRSMNPDGSYDTVGYSDSVPEKHYSDFFNNAISKVNSIHKLIHDNNVPLDLIFVTEHLNTALINLLKNDPSKIDFLEWRAFEELIAELLASYGWKVSLTSKTRDNGYDIFAVKKDSAGINQSWLVECKKWSKERKIGIDVIRSLYTVKNDLSVGNIMLATTSSFSNEVVKYKSSKYDLELKDYRNIIDWINEYQPNPNGKLYVKSNRLIIP